MNNSSFNDYSTVSEVTLGQPGKSGHLHNQDIFVWSQSVRIIQVPLYTQNVFPNLNTLASIVLSIPVSTASVERSFSQMELTKTRLHSSLSDSTLSHLMEIGMESPDSLTDGNLKNIVDIWSRKCRRIPV